MDMAQIDRLLEKHPQDNSALVAILQEVQRQEGYLGRKTLGGLSQKLKVPLSRLYGLATFYRSFSLVPTGRHRVHVCLGTACHVRGGQAVLNQLARLLGVPPGGTTSDRKFTVETVRCLGCCSIGPVVRVDQEVFGRVRQDKVSKILRNFA
ncbi:MAG: NAD(P)H-dependent oxidoreductase subunit E [Planctomycetes bacterium]|nr:NAD(P)H-dependent oxidoreductase subunit E [Planctomycetota bacterium]